MRSPRTESCLIWPARPLRRAIPFSFKGVAGRRPRSFVSAAMTVG